MVEKPSYGKAIGGAFLVGGMLGVVGEALVVLYSHTPLYAAGFSTIVALATLGLIGAVLFIVGIYPKLETFGGMGAVLPFSGLAAAVAGATFGVGKASGSMGKGALTSFVELLCKVVLIGTAICCLIGTAVFFTGLGAVHTAPYAPGGVLVEMVGPPNGSEAGPPNGVPVGVEPLAFVWAFVISSILCALAQLVLMLTRLPMPVFLVSLFTIGALLTPTGFMKFLASLGGGGFQVMIIDAGEAIVSTFGALLQGNFVPFLSVLCLFVFLYTIGILAGFIKIAMSKGDMVSGIVENSEVAIQD
jgi:stage V sporulation protein AC